MCSGPDASSGADKAYDADGDAASTVHVSVDEPTDAVSEWRPVNPSGASDTARSLPFSARGGPSSDQDTGGTASTGCVVSAYTTSAPPTGRSVAVDSVNDGVTGSTGVVTDVSTVHV